MEDKSQSEVLTIKEPTKITKSSESIDIDPLKLKVYQKRWLMLIIYIIYAGTNASQWIEYSIITNIITRFYGVSSMMVHWTSMSFLAFYATFIFPASYMTDKCGLRWTIIIGAGLNCLGSWIKILSIQPDRFYLTFIGHSIVALAQTMVLPLPGRLAAQWFPPNQLSTATSLGIFGIQLGVALGFLLGPIIVKNHQNLDDIGKDLTYLCWIVAIVCTIAFGLVLTLFQNEPKLPPSETRALQKMNRTKKREKFMGPIKRLCRNKNYIMLCNSYGLNVGVLNAVSTLLNQIFLAHFENGEEDAGRIGLAIILTGMAGSVSFGIILDKTHKFKQTAVTVYFLTLCGQILFAVFTCMGIKWMVYVSAIFLGYFMSGYLAMGYDLCTEYTYPESENISAGLLNITTSIYGIILIISLESLMNMYGDIPVHIGLCLALLLGFILTAITKDEQRRQDARKKTQYERIARIEMNVNGIPETNQHTYFNIT
ncbi:Feline leukemia virus subgroup C receptor-related protein 2 [Trachymyrmex septentrionalis]|uniref:Feline leukemia virus subgroup C receptor-related protein 2 n=1 Tax=Trachymyrmex septentrionalis TaxID=34720 RepID=A0A195FT00_9HYME|nr:PREDICTED: feline leukemia virus subgroup C receptor-related protein 2-like [Trachymyrmex septentrionalis]XP_018356550.1 PREDICTED: feline leukemia virus subgroup C receptor-related protein 2-like [Trachymyrmex septentrionalis]KYN43720.1 Feline leukemia virus subgroup C receptor-related protein 2 [Trachymyrmex septentrionalis]